MKSPEMKFGDFAIIQPSVHLERGTEYSFIAMEDVEPRRKEVIPGQRRFWGNSSGSRFANGDVLFARITPCLEHGKAAKVSNLPESIGFGSTEFFVFRAKPDISDADYIYYLAHSEIIRGPAIKSMIGASGRQRAQRTVVENTIVRSPNIREQTEIAQILSSYDDLIANNRRRIGLLENSVRLLYREWFVHFRFPGHEHVKIINNIPSGWTKKPLGDIAPLNYGKALKSDTRRDGPYPVYGSSGIVGFHETPCVKGPAIILGRKGNVGSVYWSDGDFHPIDTVYFIKAESCNRYLFYALKDLQFINTDVAVPGLNRDLAHSREVLIPKDNLLQLFEESVSPFHAQISNLEKYNAALASARDILLPKLMSGEIPV